MTPPARGRGTSQRSPTVLVRESSKLYPPAILSRKRKSKKVQAASRKQAALHARRSSNRPIKCIICNIC